MSQKDISSFPLPFYILLCPQFFAIYKDKFLKWEAHWVPWFLTSVFSWRPSGLFCLGTSSVLQVWDDHIYETLAVDQEELPFLEFKESDSKLSSQECSSSVREAAWCSARSPPSFLGLSCIAVEAHVSSAGDDSKMSHCICRYIGIKGGKTLFVNDTIWV